MSFLASRLPMSQAGAKAFRRRLVLMGPFLAVFLLCPDVSAEMGELDIRTLEYSAEVARIRGVSLAAPLRTVRAPASEGRGVAFALEPLVREGHRLHRALGLVSGDASADPRPEPMVSALPTYYSTKNGQGTIVVLPGKGKRGRQDMAHWIAVHQAILDQRGLLVQPGPEADVDHRLARQALIWGDGILSWLSRGSLPQHGSVTERQEWADERLKTLLKGWSRAEDSLVRQVAYEQLRLGLRGAVTLRHTAPWRVFDDLHRRGLARTTAQLVSPEWLVEDRRPRDITLPPVDHFASVSEGSPPEQGVVGALRLRMWLEQHLTPDEAHGAVEGWAGDRYLRYPRPSGPDLVVLFTAWSLGAESTAEQQAGHFVSALRHVLGQSMAAAGGEERPEEGPWPTAEGNMFFVQQRGDQVLALLHCPPNLLDQAAEQVWSRVVVGRPDLHALVDEDAQMTAPIAPMEPPEPWYRRTPGVVALVLWLFVLLPAICFWAVRRQRGSLVRWYLRGIAVTVLVVFLVWITGR